MKTKNRITFLALNVFDSTGGIQNVCRTFTYTLSSLFGNKFTAISLHDHGPDTKYTGTGYFKGLGGKKLPFIWRALISGRRSTHVILSHVNLVPAAIAVRLFNPDVKIIIFAHGTEIWRGLPIWKKWFMNRYLHVWSVSNYTDKVLNDRHHLYKPSSIINNCLDPFFRVPANFDKPGYLIRRYSLAIGQPILLTICRLNEHEHFKGYGQVVLLMKKLVHEFPSIHYLLCGQADQKELDRLNSLITMNNLNAHISLCGFIHAQELTDHYLLADIFIMPSQKEGFGLVLIEAAVCGRRIIAGNKDGSRDALLNGCLGHLIDPSDPEGLYRAIVCNLRKKHNLKAKEKLQAVTLAHFGHERYQTKIKDALFNC